MSDSEMTESSESDPTTSDSELADKFTFHLDHNEMAYEMVPYQHDFGTGEGGGMYIDDTDGESSDSPFESGLSHATSAEILCSFLQFAFNVYLPVIMHVVDTLLMIDIMILYFDEKDTWYIILSFIFIFQYRLVSTLWIYSVYRSRWKTICQILDVQIFVDVYRCIKHQYQFQVVTEIHYIQGCMQSFFHSILACLYLYHSPDADGVLVLSIIFWLLSITISICGHDNNAFFSPQLERQCCLTGQSCISPTRTLPCLIFMRAIFRFMEICVQGCFFLYLAISPILGHVALIAYAVLFPTLTSVIYSRRTTENWLKSIHFGMISMCSIPTLSATSVETFWLGEARKLHENKKCEEIARQKNQKRIEVMIKHGEKDNDEITRIFYEEFELDETQMPPEPDTNICFKDNPICVVQVFAKILFSVVVLCPFILYDIIVEFSITKRILIMFFLIASTVLILCLTNITQHMKREKVDVMNQYVRPGELFGLENQMCVGVTFTPDLLMQVGEWCWENKAYRALDMMLSNGVDFTMKQDEWTLMSLSTVWNRYHTVQRLIQYGDDVDQCEEDGITPLYLCGQKGNEECCDLLIAAKADPNFLCDNSCGPLYVASELGHLTVIKRLIQAGAKINVVNDAGTTPLTIASMFGYDDIVEYLLEMRADLNFELPETSHTIEQELVGLTAFECAEKYECANSMAILKTYEEFQKQEKLALGRDW